MALTLEAEKGFQNIFGKNEYFNEFVSRQIENIDKEYIDKYSFDKLEKLGHSFSNYDLLNKTQRIQAVVNTRKVLYKITQLYSKIHEENSYQLRLSNIDNYRKQSYQFSLNDNLINLPGVGPKLVESLSKLGIYLIKDLILYFPRDYLDYSKVKNIYELQSGETSTIIGRIRKCNSFVSPRNRKLSILNIQIQDKTGRVQVTKFFVGKRLSNYSFLKKQQSNYPIGSLIAVSGAVKEGPYGKSFNDPNIELLDSYTSTIKSNTIGRLIPVYALTSGVTSERFRNIINLALPFTSAWKEPLDISRCQALNLITTSEALFHIHKPKDQDSLTAARKRLVFNEFLFLQLSLLLRRNQLKKNATPLFVASRSKNSLVDNFLNLLPFQLTSAQQRVLKEIDYDLALSEPMARLVQGDVGSGKTIIAITTLLKAVQSDCQGALMAPTEVLAQQHYQNLCKWLPELHITVDLLTGSTSKAKKREILANLSSGGLQIIVGTHSLIEDSVVFNRLGVVVVDEQHRFGVNQRNYLLNKGSQPHLLSMTATPIPRTLALSVHGDLDISQIDELPPGRSPIETTIFTTSQRNKVYKVMEETVSLGQQVYYVLPLVEESEKLDLRSAIDVYHELTIGPFKDSQVGLLHGKLTPKEKELVIREFYAGKFQILVSTTVIEVGIDVPQATLMVIDNADRFGLAQLHQLRGRVGRGFQSSKCILIDSCKSTSAKKRLEILVNSNDGFEISELDLEIRGPGQVLGTRQSGLPDFALASLMDDISVLDLARKEALSILQRDPFLEKNEYLREHLESRKSRFEQNTHLN